MKKAKLKFPYLKLAIAALLAFGIARGYYRLTDDFRLGNIIYAMPHNPRWEIEALTPEKDQQLNIILDQKFSYIGKGAQSYVFVSEDGGYVLKFFKFKHLKPSVFVDLLPPVYPFADYKQKQNVRKQRKLFGVFDGYKLAYDKHRREAGLIYIHLNADSGLVNRSVEVKDKIGITRTIDLNSVVFVVQECAKTSRSVILEQLSHDDVDAAKASIRTLLDLYRSEYAKGILDHDHGVMRNTGFIGNRPIHLDVGKLHEEPEIMLKEHALVDMTKVAVKIAQKVKEKAPLYYPQVLQELEAYIAEAYHRQISLEEQGRLVGFPL